MKPVHRTIFRSEIVELPGETLISELHVFASDADQAESLPRSMAWIAGQRPITYPRYETLN